MPVVLTSTVSDLRAYLEDFRGLGNSIALVPTMGALHAGHLSLVRLAATQADAVVASIFVNPLQFGRNEDLARYPRQMEKDLAMLDEANVALCYAPAPEDMYPPGFSTEVVVKGLSDTLCGEFRPGHFGGVATVVTKLLLQLKPDVAVFGEKDYQQLLIIRQLVQDLDMPVAILSGPTVREPDGLALSSRNAHLSEKERKIAPALYAMLKRTAETLHTHADDVTHMLERAARDLMLAGFNKVDYIALCNPHTLKPLKTLEKPARLFVAAWIGQTRLIDNIPVE